MTPFRNIVKPWRSIILLSLGWSQLVAGQETNSHVSGLVKTENNEVLSHATVILLHEPTKNVYFSTTNEKGLFHFFNIRPGGPYSITISHTGFSALSKNGLFINNSNPHFYSAMQVDDFSVFLLSKLNTTLSNVEISARKQFVSAGSMETNISSEKIHSLPSVSRNLQDYIRLVPQARTDGDGMISLAGQNNKFNAFYIDGSNYNDMLGLAISGVIGGQTNSPPISIEAIEQINVALSPFDVQYSHFTGGTINAITRSGTNGFQSSAWYFFRNEKMAGRSPLPVDVPGNPGLTKRTRLSDFHNQTTGIWTSGPLVKNKLFYFFLTEIQQEQQPQHYIFSEYRGISTLEQITELANTLRSRFGYEAGSFLHSSNDLKANRFILKLDWNPGASNKMTLSYRYNNAERIAPQTQNGSTMIRFSNNHFSIPTVTHSLSFEWKKYFKKQVSNRLLITYNNDVSDREIIGQPFPVVAINDGPATIIFGSNGTGQLNIFKAAELTLLNITRFVKNKQAISAGLDLGLSEITDLALNSYFGQYQYRSLADFMIDNYPSRYVRNISLVDNPRNNHSAAASRFNSLRLGAFINNEVQATEKLKINFGVRIDGNSLPLSYKEDVFFNTVAMPEIKKYYDIEDARSGHTMKTAWQVSPRAAFQYKTAAQKLTLRGGAGFFTGRILNVWASQVYSVNSYNLNINPAAFGLRFNPNPYEQPDLQTLGIDPETSKGNKVLMARHYKFPAVFRTSASAEKVFPNGWTASTELIFTKNIHENRYKNINLLPPERTTAPPDRRYIHSLTNNPALIPMPGGNPYNTIILLANNYQQKGYAYSFTLSVSKSFKNRLSVTAAYTYGNAKAIHDPNGISNDNFSQWTQTETVNGKNTALRARSDFSTGHRIITNLTQKINLGKWSTIVTLFYTGQSGSPFSYVYNGSMINDNGGQSNADLVYIPTQTELTNMVYLPLTINGISYSPEEQKALLNKFIEQDKYLRRHRGQFAERNGARLPFSNILDLRIRQDFKIKTRKKEIQFSLLYDVFNFTNMLNKNWGRIYSMSGDNYRLIQFSGFINTVSLTPQYQFIPSAGQPWSVQNSTAPGSSARWISQLGIRINLL